MDQESVLVGFHFFWRELDGENLKTFFDDAFAGFDCEYPEKKENTCIKIKTSGKKIGNQQKRYKF